MEENNYLLLVSRDDFTEIFLNHLGLVFFLQFLKEIRAWRKLQHKKKIKFKMITFDKFFELNPEFVRRILSQMTVALVKL